MSYGYCPTCGEPGMLRERRLNGNDTCARGHTYPSALASNLPLVAEQKTQQEVADMLALHLEGNLTKKALAEQIGVSPGIVSDVLNMRRAPHGKVLAFLGLKSVRTTTLMYEPVKPYNDGNGVG